MFWNLSKKKCYRVLSLKRAHLLGARPTYEEVDEIFARTRCVALGLGVTCVLILLVVIPVSLQSQRELSEDQLTAYVR